MDIHFPMGSRVHQLLWVRPSVRPACEHERGRGLYGQQHSSTGA